MSTPIAARVDPLKIYQLRVEQGLSFKEIAKITGVTKSAIHQRWHRLLSVLPNKQEIQTYIDNKPTVLQGAELAMVGSLLDQSKIKKASLNNVAYALTQVSQLRRLEEGKSTVNIGLKTQLIMAAHKVDKPEQGKPVTDNKVDKSTDSV